MVLFLKHIIPSLEANFNRKFDWIDDMEQDKHFFDVYPFEHIWLKIARLGRPSLTFQAELPKVNPIIDIGGYGLFKEYEL